MAEDILAFQNALKAHFLNISPILSTFDAKTISQIFQPHLAEGRSPSLTIDGSPKVID